MKIAKILPERLLHRLGFTYKQTIEHEGLKFRIRNFSSDFTIFYEIFFSKNYTKNFEIPDNSIVVDIGAHIGLFSLMASRIAKRVYSFEPEPENFNLLLTNINLNSIKNIEAINKAMSKKTGKAKLHVSDYDESECSLGSKGIDVVTISLKDFFDTYDIKKIDFLKMDCEGSEYDIIMNTPKEYLERIGKISMEVHKTNMFIEDISKFLSKNGFSIKSVTHDKHFKTGMIHAIRE
jgi:FkbM family methyltransferase